MHGYLDTRRQLAGGSPSSYPGLPSYATLPRHCPLAQGPPHTQYHPPSTVWAAHPVSSAPAWRLFPKIMTQLITQPNLLEATPNGLRDSRFTLDSRNGPMPVRHYSLGSAGGLATCSPANAERLRAITTATPRRAITARTATERSWRDGKRSRSSTGFEWTISVRFLSYRTYWSPPCEPHHILFVWILLWDISSAFLTRFTETRRPQWMAIVGIGLLLVTFAVAHRQEL